MDFETLAVCKKYTEETAEQFGAVKGAPCKIYSTKEDSDGNVDVTFEWKNDANEKKYSTIKVRKGIDVKGAMVNSEGHLIITLSDGTEIDCGEITADTTLQEGIVCTVSIGSVTSGKKYEKGTPLEDIIRDILIKVEPPSVSSVVNLPSKIFNRLTDSVSEIPYTVSFAARTNPVKELKVYINNTLMDTVSLEGKSSPVKGTVRVSTALTESFVFKAEVSDVEGLSSNSSEKIYFVYPSYYGLVAPEIGTPTEAQIKTLNTALKTDKGYVYKGITCEYNKVVYAYPADYSPLSSIKDVDNNVNYTASFSRTSLKIGDVNYYCYTLNEPTGADGVNLTFA